MATPIVTAIVNKVGRTIYRKAGRFISRNTFLRETGKVPKTVAGLARKLLEELGPPIGDGDWVSRVRKSTERFTDVLADENELG